MSEPTPGGPPPEAPTPPTPPAGAYSSAPPGATSAPGVMPPGATSAPGAMPPGSMPPPPGAMPPPYGSMPPPPGAMPPGYGGPAYRPAGYGMPGPGMGYAPVRPSTPGTAIAGFVCSLVGLLFFPIIFSIAGLVLSIIGRRQARETHAPTGLATAGFWISVASLVLWGALLIVYIIAFAVMLSSGEWETTTSAVSPLFF